jgi:hypothetical protein
MHFTSDSLKFVASPWKALLIMVYSVCLVSLGVWLKQSGCCRTPRARSMAAALAGMEGAIPNHYNATLEEILEALNAWRQRYGQ